MTTFVHVEHPAQHPGVLRAERAAGAISAAAGKLPSPARLARGVLAVAVAGMLVAAAHWVDIWTESHLLAAWTALWLVGFAAAALYWPAMARGAARVRGVQQAWSAARRQRLEDERYWNAALNDARIMADISRAMTAAAGSDAQPRD